MAAGAFYGGIQYGQSNSMAAAGNAIRFGNFSGTNRQFSDGTTTRPAGIRNSGGMILGEILSKDENSLTVKLMDGGSRIVLLGKDTQVMENTEGSLDDLLVGTEIAVNGMTDQEGIISASTIQIRPSVPGRFGI